MNPRKIERGFRMIRMLYATGMRIMLFQLSALVVRWSSDSFTRDVCRNEELSVVCYAVVYYKASYKITCLCYMICYVVRSFCMLKHNFFL